MRGPVVALRGSRTYTSITRAAVLAGFSTFAQLYCLQPLLPRLAGDFGITPARSSLVVSASTLALAGGLLLGTVLADRLPRKGLMCSALLGSSVLTVASALSPSFPLLVASSACRGFVLSGVPAIAMAYVGEEVEPAALGRAMGLYISGTILGGMSGRVVTSLLAAWLSWRWAVGLVGAACFLVALGLTRSMPASRHFHPRRREVRAVLRGALHYLGDPALLALYAFAGLMMGSFVSVYNYLGFRLEAPPFELPRPLIGALFSMYAVGILGSSLAGHWSDRMERRGLLWRLAALTLGGLVLMLPERLPVVALGLTLFTFGFFGAHTVASGWVSTRAQQGRAVASSLYLLFYYVGSSVLGTWSGVVVHAHGWAGLVAVLGLCVGAALLLALGLRRPQPPGKS